MTGPEGTIEKEMAPVTEADRITDWRMKVALDAGAEPEVATHISTTWSVDLHEWLDMVTQGCDPGLAFKILEP